MWIWSCLINGIFILRWSPDFTPCHASHTQLSNDRYMVYMLHDQISCHTCPNGVIISVVDGSAPIWLWGFCKHHATAMSSCWRNYHHWLQRSSSGGHDRDFMNMMMFPFQWLISITCHQVISSLDCSHVMCGQLWPDTHFRVERDGLASNEKLPESNSYSYYLWTGIDGSK